jgi:hypothetical protein
LSGRDQRPEHAQNERVILDLEAAAYERGWREAVTGIVDLLRGEAEGRRLMWLGAGLSPPPEAQIRELHMAADLIEREFGADEEDGDD